MSPKDDSKTINETENQESLYDAYLWLARHLRMQGTDGHPTREMPVVKIRGPVSR